MLQKIENDLLKIGISSSGAELKSIFQKKSAREYCWKGNPDWWPRSAPVLFPIVGKLNNNSVRINGKDYPLPQHGFARDKEFEMTDQQQDSVTFALRSTDDLLKQYPFPFLLQILYSLKGDSLHVRYEVTNTGTTTGYFSLGAHPGFALASGEVLQDYYLEFEHAETLDRHLLENGLFTGETEPVMINTDRLDIDENLFKKDAIVFKRMKSEFVFLRSRKSDYALKYSFQEFPYFGIWSKPGAPFICLEPWCGLADKAGFTGDISEKEGIVTLEGGGVFVRETSLTC